MEDEGLDKANLEEVPTDTTPQLDESVVLSRLEGHRSEEVFCPLCSRVLNPPDAQKCSNCGADIAGAREAIKLGEEVLLGIERALRHGDLLAVEEGLMQLDRISHGQRPKATFLRAKLCFLEKDYAKSIAMANSIIEEVEVDEDLQKEVEAELPLWQEELRKKIESQEHYNFALSRIRDGYLEEAHDHLLKAIKLAPHLPENFRLLGKVFMRLREFDEGRYYIERALLLDEEDDTARELLTELERSEKLELLHKQKRRFILALAIVFSAAALVTIITVLSIYLPKLIS